MKELLDALISYKFGEKFRRLVFFSLLVLVMFHGFVLLSPFVSIKESKPFFSEKQVKGLQYASNAIANITVALVLMVVVIEGKNGIRSYIMSRRRATYKQIRDEILKWMMLTRPLVFDAEDKKAKFITGSELDMNEVLQHLKVAGSISRLMDVYGYSPELRDAVQNYSELVHFEFTRYPAELLYGIHFEIDDYAISEKLCATLIDLLNFAKQSARFAVDKETPKKPGWVFLTRSIELSGDMDKDFAIVMTHARHFVELVCHSYDGLYSREMIDCYLHLVGKISAKTSEVELVS